MKYLLLLCSVSAMGGLLFGYDWVLIGGAKIFYESYFAIEGLPALRGWAMSCALTGCLAGALLSGMWSDRYGRKKMLVLAAVLFILSAIGVGAAHSFGWFVALRILGGFGIGIASNVSPVYIAEVAPAPVRGKFVSLNQMTIVVGILAAQIVNYLIAESFTEAGTTLNPHSIEWAWRWMFWAGAIPAVAFFALTFLIPESPRYLAVNGHRDEAGRIFARIGSEGYAAEALDGIAAATNASTEKGGFKSLLQPNIRNVLTIGIVLAFFQQACGINIIFNYAHEIFSAAGYAVSDILMNIVVTGVTNLIFTFVAIYMVDRWGRRTLMLIGSGGLLLIYAAMGTLYFFEIHGLPLLSLVVIAIACFAMSIGPVVWVLLSEIFPNRIRGMAMAVSTFCLWAASFLMTYTFPLLNDALGASGVFWLYGGVCLAGFLFCWRMVPETKNKTLEEIEKQLTSKE